MALPQAMEEGGEGENLELQAAVPEDVQAVMAAAEDGDAEALSQALGEQHHITLLHIPSHHINITFTFRSSSSSSFSWAFLLDPSEFASLLPHLLIKWRHTDLRLRNCSK